MRTHRTRRTGGGFTQIANRWIDAGYMKAAPGSVTQVYLHLCRWSDNDSDEAEQPLRLIAQMTGLSEDVARKAIRMLERWGVIERDPEPGKNGVNVWILLELSEKAPPYPAKNAVPARGSEKSGGSEKSTPQQSRPPNKSLPLNQTKLTNQTEVEDHTDVQDQTDFPEQTKTSGPPGPAAKPHLAPAQNRKSETETETPFGLFVAWCETVGLNAADFGQKEKGKQLAIAKRLLADGMTAEDVTRVTQWLQSQTWREGGIDLFDIERARTKWRAAGSPKRQQANQQPAQTAAERDRTIDPEIWLGKYADTLIARGQFVDGRET